MDKLLRILIVDDDQRMTRTLADILSMSGYQTAEAPSGPEALDQVRNNFFDFVLTDVRMPGMDGVELHRQLREIQPGLPVVLMSAYASDDIIRTGLDEGIVGVFEKPLEINYLLSFLTSLARSRFVVVVDDDPDFSKTIAGILQQRGFNVLQISDPHSGVEQMAGEAQVILLDMKLDGLTGLDVLKTIRQRYPELPVILITGYRQEMSSVIQASRQINVYACLYKPLEIPTLLKTLSDLQLKRLRKLFKVR